MTTLWVLAVVVVGVTLVAFVLARRRSSAHRTLGRDLDDRLAAALGPDSHSHLERSPTVREIAVIDEDTSESDGEPALVPIVRVDLGTTDAPGMELLFDYVAAVLETIHPAVEDHPIAHYDVEFTFGPSGLLVSGECRRVSVPVAMADRLCTEDRYRARDLWQAVERGDRDEESVATLWGECREY